MLGYARQSFPGALFLVISLGGLTGGCGEPPRPTTGLVVADTVGDTIVILSQSTPLWPKERALVADLRIGSLDGDEWHTFGDIADVAVGPMGQIFVVDAMAGRVLRYGPDGAFQGLVGRKGEGPGEYSMPGEVASFGDGRILIRDLGRRRFLVFEPGGQFLNEWSVGSSVIFSGTMIDAADRIVAKTAFDTYKRFSPRSTGFVLYSAEGAVLDTVPPPTTPWDEEASWGTFLPEKHVEWHPFGFPIVGVSSRYRFDLRQVDSHVVRVNASGTAVPVSPGELRAHEALLEAYRRRGMQDVDQFPQPGRIKPSYKRLLIARSGEVWVIRHTEAVQWEPRRAGDVEIPRWEEPLLADIFAPTGIHLGSVAALSGIEPRFASGDTLWATTVGPHDEQYVVRYLLR